MEMKEYLSQAFRIDQRINSKLDQLAALNDLARKATMLYHRNPGGSSRNIHETEDVIVKIIDLENEINDEIDELVDLKVEIRETIKNVDDLEYQTLLEKRYLCFQTWEQIASDMGYEIRWIYQLHNKALSAVAKKTKLFTKRH
ncbi:MAG: DUF1492 domain-containing protein [Clostridium sp.]|nr:DUF1492 domain-containing protein [Clostridium sp.]